MMNATQELHQLQKRIRRSVMLLVTNSYCMKKSCADYDKRSKIMCVRMHPDKCALSVKEVNEAFNK